MKAIADDCGEKMWVGKGNESIRLMYDLRRVWRRFN